MARFFERLPSLRASLPWILFALSVTLNVFFLGGYYYKRTFDQRLLANEQARVRYVMDQLHFDPEQRDRFQAFREHTRERQHTMFRANHPVIDNLWREIEKPQPDTAQLDDYINTLTANRLAFQRAQTTWSRSPRRSRPGSAWTSSSWCGRGSNAVSLADPR